MSSFKTELVLKDLNDKGWALKEGLLYQSSMLKTFVSIPVGFVTDLASIPRFPPIIYALLADSARAAAVVHDFLYQTHGASGHKVSRRTADLVLMEAMKVGGIPLWKRELIYAGVRVGGWSSWSSGPSRYRVI